MNTKGVIYILTNPSFPDYVKIGYADNMENRLKQLNRSECIPFAFRVYAIYEVSTRLSDLKLHKIIDKLNPDLRSIDDFNGQKRIREFSLHLIHGALLTDIFIRVVTFFVVILLISTGIGIFLGIIQLEELWFYALLETGIILIFAGILTPKLKRQNYSLNLRDGGVI